jgi:hypothetical protein
MKLTRYFTGKASANRKILYRPVFAAAEREKGGAGWLLSEGLPVSGGDG